MFNYENQGTTTYLVYKLQQEDEVDSLVMGMLTNNKIPGIAPVIYTQMDSEEFIKYNVSSKVSAKQMFAGTVDKKHFLGILKGIVAACTAVEEYMIDVSSILLEWEYIFTDVSTGATTLICVPVKNHDRKNEKLEVIIKDLMNSIQFNQNENCDYIAYILNYLNNSDEFTLKGFAKVVEDAQNGKINSASVQQAAPVQQSAPVQQPAPQAYGQVAPQTYGQPAPQAYGQPAAAAPQTYGQPATSAPQAYGQPVASTPQTYGQSAPQTYGQVAPQTYGQPAAPISQAVQTASTAQGIYGSAQSIATPSPAVAAPKASVPNKPAMPARPTSGKLKNDAPFAVPGQDNIMPKRESEKLAEEADEEQISLYHLLSHYNKENAATYKRQRAKKKAEKQKAKTSGTSNYSMNIPGSSNDFGNDTVSSIPQPSIPTAQPVMPAAQPVMPAAQPVMPAAQPVMPAAQPVMPAAQPVMPAAQPVMAEAQPVMPVAQPVMPAAQPVMSAAQPTVLASGAASFGETTVLGGTGAYGETTVLGADNAFTTEKKAFFVRLKTNEKVNITKTNFRIGKEKSYVDYFIGDNTAVSRSHAEIIKKDGDYYIIDTNSTNHTFVNDVMIQSNVETKLTSGAKFKLANEVFEFQVE